jgi:hypothetical protein
MAIFLNEAYEALQVSLGFGDVGIRSFAALNTGGNPVGVLGFNQLARSYSHDEAVPDEPGEKYATVIISSTSDESFRVLARRLKRSRIMLAKRKAIDGIVSDNAHGPRSDDR